MNIIYRIKEPWLMLRLFHIFSGRTDYLTYVELRIQEYLKIKVFIESIDLN
jgi:hypothetical protein